MWATASICFWHMWIVWHFVLKSKRTTVWSNSSCSYGEYPATQTADAALRLLWRTEFEELHYHYMELHGPFPHELPNIYCASDLKWNCLFSHQKHYNYFTIIYLYRSISCKKDILFKQLIQFILFFIHWAVTCSHCAQFLLVLKIPN